MDLLIRFSVSVAVVIVTLVLYQTSLGGRKLVEHNLSSNVEYTKLTYSVDRHNNPNDAITTAESSYNRLVYDTLVEYDSRLNIRPRIAKTWRFSDSGRMLFFEIRDSIRFSDGSQLRTSDVVESLKYLAFESANSVHFLNVKKVSSTEEYKITIELEEASSSIIPLLASSFSAIYKQGRPSIGSGPFVFSEEDHNCLKLTPSPFRNTKIGILKLCQTSESEAIKLLQEGKAHDMIDIFISNESPSVDQKFAVRKEIKSTYTWLLALNQKNKVLSSLKNRRCLDHSFDRMRFVELFVPSQTPANLMVPQLSNVFVPSSKKFNCDPDHHGKTLNVSVPNEIEFSMEICEFIKEQFSKLKLKTSCQTMPFTKVLEQMKANSFEVSLLAIGLEIPDPLYPFSFFSKSSPFLLSGKPSVEVEKILKDSGHRYAGKERFENLKKLNNLVKINSLAIPISVTGHTTLIGRCTVNLELSPFGPSFVNYELVNLKKRCK